jgi:hypothetical protein
MMLTANSKDNVTETLLSQKQELDSITKLKLKSAKKKKLLLARKFLKRSTCLEDTSQDSNLLRHAVLDTASIKKWIPAFAGMT